MPAHVRAVDLPTGIYWDRARRNWYTILDKKRIKLGDAKATIADLQTRLAAMRGIDRDSLDWLMGAFQDSAEFARLAESTQRDYKQYRKDISEYTTRAGKLGKLPAARLSTPLFQGIVDKLEKAGTPTKANHWLRYLRRLYSFALRRTSIAVNPCKGVQQAHERKRRDVPTEAVYQRVLEFARAGGERKAHSRGALPGYLWMAMELMYLCRLRSVEVITLTDALARKSGLMTNRRKGSRDNIVAWTPRLKAVWTAAMDRRKRLWSRPGIVVSLDPAQRIVLVSDSGQPLKPNTIQLAWRNLMRRAIAAKVIKPEERFTSHGCKHKGVTDSPGNRHDKQQASGHRSERMMDVYDHEVPVVPTSERPQSS